MCCTDVPDLAAYLAPPLSRRGELLQMQARVAACCCCCCCPQILCIRAYYCPGWQAAKCCCRQQRRNRDCARSECSSSTWQACKLLHISRTSLRPQAAFSSTMSCMCAMRAVWSQIADAGTATCRYWATTAAWGFVPSSPDPVASCYAAQAFHTRVGSSQSY
jgi:hypothetical protein